MECIHIYQNGENNQVKVFTVDSKLRPAQFANRINKEILLKKFYCYDLVVYSKQPASMLSQELSLIPRI